MQILWLTSRGSDDRTLQDQRLHLQLLTSSLSSEGGLPSSTSFPHHESPGTKLRHNVALGEAPLFDDTSQNLSSAARSR